MIIKTNKSIKILMTIISLVALCSISWATAGVTQISLNPTKHHPEARGSMVIGGQSVNVQARGLKPDSIYTVWFVNMKPKKHEKGAGDPPYMFKTDSHGNGNYSASLKASPFGKWQMVMVVLHPNGNPEDMKQMVGALSAKL